MWLCVKKKHRIYEGKMLWKLQSGLQMLVYVFTQLKQKLPMPSVPCRLKQTSVFGWDTGMVGGMVTFCTENSIVLGLARMQMVFHCWNWSGMVGEALRHGFHWIGLQAFKKSLNNNAVQVPTWRGQLLDSFFFKFPSNKWQWHILVPFHAIPDFSEAAGASCLPWQGSLALALQQSREPAVLQGNCKILLNILKMKLNIHFILIYICHPVLLEDVSTVEWHGQPSYGSALKCSCEFSA